MKRSSFTFRFSPATLVFYAAALGVYLLADAVGRRVGNTFSAGWFSGIIAGIIATDLIRATKS